MMKKIALLLALCLLLTGCGGAAPEGTTATTETTQTEPQIKTLYVDGSSVELASQGALREYDLGKGEHSVLPLRDGVLLFSQTEGSATRITRLSGEKLTEGERIWLAGSVLPLVWQTSPDGKTFAYCDYKQGCCRIYNSALQEIQGISFPEDCVGGTCLSADFRYLYYTTKDAIRVLDTKLGVSRPLRQGNMEGKLLSAPAFGGTMLHYYDESGETFQNGYIDIETGELIYTIPEILVWATGPEAYYFKKAPSVLQFGKVGEELQQLQLTEATTFQDILPQTGLVLALDTETQCIGCYDTVSGKKTAEITLPEGLQADEAVFTAQGDGVWIVCAEKLLLWHTASSPVEDDTVYTEKVK